LRNFRTEYADKIYSQSYINKPPTNVSPQIPDKSPSNISPANPDKGPSFVSPVNPNKPPSNISPVNPDKGPSFVSPVNPNKPPSNISPAKPDKSPSGISPTIPEKGDSVCNAVNSCPLAMAYVPWQSWNQVYEPPKALERGTLFPELDLPFLGGGAY
jgi:hypothetical protein